MTLAMSSAAPEDSGLASGLVNTTQQVGGALGLAILATVAENRTGDSTAAAALVDGYGAAFEVASALVLAALVLAVVILRPPPRAQGVRGRRTRRGHRLTRHRAGGAPGNFCPPRVRRGKPMSPRPRAAATAATRQLGNRAKGSARACR